MCGNQREKKPLKRYSDHLDVPADAGFRKIDEFSAKPRINQYKRGKHTPDFHTAERLAKVLGCPTTYLYTREDDLAELILLWADLPERQKRRLLSQIRRQVGGAPR